MSWYNLNNKTESKKEYLARTKYEQLISKKIESFKDIGNFELSEKIQYRLITEKSFNAIVVINFILNNYDIDEITIAIYRMNQKAVNKLKEIIEQNNIKLTILLSSFFRENKRYERWAEELITFSKNNNNANVYFAWSHAKVCLIKTKCGKHIVFEGSGNLSDNARIEQYILENNKQIFEFHNEWIKKEADENK